jgi:hypothetical protein
MSCFPFVFEASRKRAKRAAASNEKVLKKPVVRKNLAAKQADNDRLSLEVKRLSKQLSAERSYCKARCLELTDLKKVNAHLRGSKKEQAAELTKVQTELAKARSERDAARRATRRWELWYEQVCEDTSRGWGNNPCQVARALGESTFAKRHKQLGKPVFAKSHGHLGELVGPIVRFRKRGRGPSSSCSGSGCRSDLRTVAGEAASDSTESGPAMALSGKN